MSGWYIYPRKIVCVVFYCYLNTFQSLKSIVGFFLPKNSEKGTFLIFDEKRADFIQNFCIFGAETSILTSFQFNLWTIDHEKPLEPQGIGVVLLLIDFFQKKKHFSERSYFLMFFIIKKMTIRKIRKRAIIKATASKPIIPIV